VRCSCCRHTSASTGGCWRCSFIGGAAALALAGYPQWKLADRALRRGTALPISPLPGLVSLAVAVAAILGLIAIFR